MFNKLCLTIFYLNILWFYTTQQGCLTWKFSLLLNSWIFSNLFIVLSNLLYSFIPTFALLFLKRVVLQNWIWRSDFWRVQWSCISPLYFIFSMFDFTQHTTSPIYRQSNRSIFRYLKRFLQDACQPTLSIILITFFCNEKCLYFQDHHPTESDHISTEHENMQNI